MPLPELARRIWFFLRRDRIAAELAEEMRLHVELREAGESAAKLPRRECERDPFRQQAASHPIEAVGEYATYVSRIREDSTVDNGLSMWIVSDNLRKGAALNAVQIAELLADALPAPVATA